MCNIRNDGECDGDQKKDDASRVDFTGGVLWSIRRTPKSEREVAGNEMNVVCVESFEESL
jgi:hypothetical protein